MLDGFREIAPATWTITYAPGAGIGDLVPDPAGPTYQDEQPRPPLFQSASPDPTMLQEAKRLAGDADWVVAVIGDTVALAGEGKSTATLELQGAQITPGGGAHRDRDSRHRRAHPIEAINVASLGADAAAVIEAFNPGMQGGRAIAELILGLIEPSGRLPITFARHVGQLPVYYNQIRGQQGDRYADLTQEPLFAFGEGLSYTTVEYLNLRIESDQVTREQQLTARITVTNTGNRPAIETVQAYITDSVASVTWAERELKAFTKVTVQPGESVDVTIVIPAAECSIVNAAGERIVEAGAFELMVGRSSRPRDLFCTGGFIIVD